MRYADQPAHYCCYPSAHADEQREFESLTSREHVRSSETLLPLQTSTTKCPSFSFATALALGSLMRVSAQFAADRPQDGLLIVDLFFFAGFFDADSRRNAVGFDGVPTNNRVIRG
jgi:hypothetical protein